jgi:hypothetical protein
MDYYWILDPTLAELNSVDAAGLQLSHSLRQTDVPIGDPVPFFVWVDKGILIISLGFGSFPFSHQDKTSVHG